MLFVLGLFFFAQFIVIIVIVCMLIFAVLAVPVVLARVGGDFPVPVAIGMTMPYSGQKWRVAA